MKHLATVTGRQRRVVVVAVTALAALLIGLFSATEPLLAVLATLVITGLLMLALLVFRDPTLSLQHVVVPLLVVTILLPPIRLPGGIPDLRPELVLILLAWGLLALGYLATGQPLKFYAKPTHKWFALFGLAILLSMSYAGTVRRYGLTGRDFWELAKLVEYFLIFALVANLDVSRPSLRRHYEIALIVLLCSAFLGFAQRLNLGNVNAVISPYYAPTQMRNLLRGRITGTMHNPNEFGALMALASSLALSGALFFQQRRLRLFSWGCLPIFCYATVLTISRSALIGLVIAMCFILLARYPLVAASRRSLHKLLGIIPVVVLLGLLLLWLAPENFFFRFGRLRDIASDPSWYMRLAMWESEFQIWKQSPVLGWGPGKATMETVADNEWLLVLRRYGVVGLVVFGSLFATFYLGLARIRRRFAGAEVLALTVALEATLVAYAAYMIVARVYHSLQLMPILMVFLGLAYSQSGARSRASTGESSS